MVDMPLMRLNESIYMISDLVLYYSEIVFIELFLLDKIEIAD